MRKSFIAVFLFSILVLGCAQQPFEQRNEVRARLGNTEMVVSPANNSVLTGIVWITMPRVPLGTRLAAFAIQGPGIEELEKTGPNLGIDADGSDGWGIPLQTASYPDNVYTLYAIALPSEPSNETRPLGGVQARVLIQNALT